MTKESYQRSKSAKSKIIENPKSMGTSYTQKPRSKAEYFVIAKIDGLENKSSRSNDDICKENNEL